MPNVLNCILILFIILERLFKNNLLDSVKILTDVGGECACLDVGAALSSRGVCQAPQPPTF